MANTCDTQYKVTGSRKAVADLWNTLQKLDVNSTNVYLYRLAEHYGIDYEKKGISVRGHIYWAEYEENEEDDYALLSFDTESAWSSCDLFFEEVNKALNNELSICWREVEPGCNIFYTHDENDFFTHNLSSCLFLRLVGGRKYPSIGRKASKGGKKKSPATWATKK